MKHISKTKLLLIAAMLFGAAFIYNSISVKAAPQTFIVNSTGAGYDVNDGDGICETSNSGECTLQAAINEANANGNPTEQDVIEFNIPGGGPHTITLDSGSLIIYQSLFIDGYSEPGAQPNTNPAPQPMNGTILIEIDATDMTQANGALIAYSDNVKISGLAINRSRANQILTGDYDNISITGNYLGTDTTGLIPLVNGVVQSGNLDAGGSIGAALTSNLTIGGSNPEDRNVLTSYTGFGIFGYINNPGDPNSPSNVVVKGNNFFVGSDGVTPLPPLFSQYPVGVTFDNIRGLVFGGDNEGEGNIIENTSGTGLSVGNSTNDAVIAGNRIVGNATASFNSGISIYAQAHDVRIGGTSQYSKNTIADNAGHGITIGNSYNISILGNNIGVTEDGLTALKNNAAGIELGNSHDITIGSSAQYGRNIISATNSGITTYNIQNLIIQNNAIGVGSDGTTALGTERGIVFENVTDSLIGGINANEGNIIANSTNQGIQFNGSDNQNDSMLGNSIHSNGTVGIDLDGNGVTANDPLDPDTGNNDLLNFPRVFEPVVSGGNTEVGYYTDVPAGDYRIEFFSNTTPDSTGNGEGETYIGYQNITSTGTGRQTFSTTIPGTSFTNVFATATAIDSSKASGFGPTSEFGDRALAQTTDVALTKTLDNPEDVAQGATLNYTLNYRNDGPDDLDLTQFNDLFTGKGLLIDFVAPDITPLNLGAPGPFPGTSLINNLGNPDVSCIWFPHTSAGGFGYTDHADWGVIGCEVTGNSNVVLESGNSFDLNIQFEVSGSSDLAFRNYAFALQPTESEDPDTQAISDAYGQGGDPLTAFTDAGFKVNNFATSVLPVSLSIDKSSPTPRPVLAGDTVEYQISLTNNGTTGFDLADYNQQNGPSKILFTDLYPGNMLNFDQVTTPNVSCLDVGAGSAQYIGPAASDHPDYQILNCVFTGNSTILAPGQTFTTTLEFTATNGVSDKSGFKNYAFQGSAAGNPDSVALVNLISNATSDVLDNIAGNQAFTSLSIVKPLADIKAGSILHNPSDFKPGGTVNYTMQFINDGPNAVTLADLDGSAGAYLFYDFVPPELTPQNLGGPGMFPGTTLITNTGNSDVACSWGGPGSLEMLFGPNDYPDFGLTICAYTGGGGTQAPGTSMDINFSYTIASNSDLSFNHYVLAGLPFVHSYDPDFDDATTVFTNGDDIIGQFRTTYPINNFATLVRPQVNGSGPNGQSGSAEGLSATGEDRVKVLLLAVTVLGLCTALGVFARRQYLNKH